MDIRIKNKSWGYFIYEPEIAWLLYSILFLLIPFHKSQSILKIQLDVLVNDG